MGQNRNQKTPCMSSSAGFITGNDDLLMQILVYLPISSLFRFQWVSKRWFSIITDPFFRSLHSKSTSASAAGHGTYLLYRRELNFISDQAGFVNVMEDTVFDMDKLFNHVMKGLDDGRICKIHSCNGLVAICLSYNGYVDLFVYNPAIRQCKKIPHNFLDPEFGSVMFLNIAFDPWKSDHYKLVCVSWRRKKVWIYSSEYQVWHCHDCLRGYADGKDVMWHAGIFWNGDLHWTSQHGSCKCLDLDEEVMLYMPNHPQGRKIGDLGPDELDEFLPDVWPDIFFFGQCGGDLCIMGLKEPQSLMLDVYNLELDYSGWTLKYCLDLSILPTLYPSMEHRVYNDGKPRRYKLLMWKRYKLSVLSCIVESENDQPAELMISLPGKVISCDTNGRIVKEIVDVVPREDKPIFRWDESFKYVETFAPA